MKQLQNNFTTPEQSKRLLELGVPDWTADCVTSRYGGSTFFVQECQLLRRCIDSNNYIPCWSVGRLMEIISICSNAPFPNEVIITRRNVDLSIVESLIERLKELANYYSLDFLKLEE